jgi:hypothetical protein
MVAFDKAFGEFAGFSAFGNRALKQDFDLAGAGSNRCFAADFLGDFDGDRSLCRYRICPGNAIQDRESRGRRSVGGNPSCAILDAVEDNMNRFAGGGGGPGDRIVFDFDLPRIILAHPAGRGRIFVANGARGDYFAVGNIVCPP